MDFGEAPAVTLAAVVTVAVVAYVAYAGVAVGPPAAKSTSAQRTSSTCSGCPPGGDCVVPYSYTFAIQISYQGAWNLTHRGTTDVGEPTERAVTGSRTGTGNFSLPVTLSGLNNQELTLAPPPASWTAPTPPSA